MSDRIKGKIEVFSFVLDVLDGMRKNRHARSCGEIVDMIERYVNTKLHVVASGEFHAGVTEGVQHFRTYFVPREDVINDDSVRYVYNGIEEKYEELLRLLEPTGPKMTLAEQWEANERR
jgi:hypothetical protein